MERDKDKDLIGPPTGGFKVKIKDTNSRDLYLNINTTGNPTFSWATTATVFVQASGDPRHIQYTDTDSTTYYVVPNSANTGLTRQSTQPCTQWSLSNSKLQWGSTGNFLNISGTTVTVDTTGSSTISFEAVAGLPCEDVPPSVGSGKAGRSSKGGTTGKNRRKDKERRKDQQTR